MARNSETAAPTKKTLSWFIKRILVVGVVVALIAVAIYLLQHFKTFSARDIIQMRRYIRTFGPLGPVLIVALIFLSTVVPPLPLPVPLVELTSGLAFGFVESFFIIWIAQITSSLVAFYITRIFKKRFFKSLTQSPVWQAYEKLLNKKGALAILITRATMSAPFNVISYLAGFAQMKVSVFLVATAIGTLPEALLYSYIGSQLRQWRGSLLSLAIVILGIGCVGLVATTIMMYLTLKPGAWRRWMFKKPPKPLDF